MGQVACFAAIVLFVGSNKDSSSGISSELVYQLYFFLLFSWIVSYGILLLTIKKEYRKTFFNGLNEHQYMSLVFVTATSEFGKLEAISGQGSHMVKNFGKPATMWLEQNWDKWKQSPPHWLNAELFESIHSSILPECAKLDMLNDPWWRRKGGVEKMNSLASFLEGPVKGPVTPQTTQSSNFNYDRDSPV